MERIELGINLDDPDYIIDLRHTNGRDPKKEYKPFWQEANRMIAEQTVANDRRHGGANMSCVISIRYVLYIHPFSK